MTSTIELHFPFNFPNPIFSDFFSPDDLVKWLLDPANANDIYDAALDDNKMLRVAHNFIKTGEAREELKEVCRELVHQIETVERALENNKWLRLRALEILLDSGIIPALGRRIPLSPVGPTALELAALPSPETFHGTPISSPTPVAPKEKNPENSILSQKGRRTSPQKELKATTPQNRQSATPYARNQQVIDLTTPSPPPEKPRTIKKPHHFSPTPGPSNTRRCYQCGDPTHLFVKCPSYQCTKCYRVAPGHYPSKCPYKEISEEGYYEWDNEAIGNITGEPSWY
ncbi:hypothetical protein H0H81_006344 [Sphagnurus paluster]|uniref:CCHC-type domain-containing protein n=1 Tax=Sphagnurus paluster TaxID=117069 RepID=A0A9P7FL94_9AGAR|nr:hypothetical protein H0H81_006344 [Sphagnurus paluster]